MRTHRARLAITLAVAGTLLSVTAARAGTLTYTDPAVITGPFTGGFFQVCPPPIACEAPPKGTIAPTDLNPFVAPLDGIVVTNLTLVYSASPSDDGQAVTLTWRAIRHFDFGPPPPFTYQNISHVDGTLVYDPAKFSVVDIVMKTNFQDFDVDQTILSTGPLAPGPFTATVPGPVMTVPLGLGAVTQFFAMTFQQNPGTTAADTISLNLPGSVISLPVPATPVLPFAALAARLELEPAEHEFELAAAFDLDAGSDGIHPLTDDVTLQIGAFSVTIPAGSFGSGKHDKDKKGKPKHRFTFEGVVDGVWLNVKITRKGSHFGLKAEGQGASLAGIVNPVTVGITIGDDGGSVAVTAEIE